MKKEEKIGEKGAGIENAVPRNQFPPTHEMCPEELIPVAPSAVSAPIPEHKNGTCDSPLPANKEETTDEKGSVISGQVAVNEDGRMKKEDRIKDQRAGSKDPEKLPPCFEIMQRVIERSRETDDNSLTFMIDEMEFLAKDPVFNHLDPAMAADIRKILEAGPP